MIQDYGSARFLNIEPKNGGHYLKENDSFCKQTISHNTLTADGRSHFDSDMKLSSKHAPEFHSFIDTEEVKLISAKEANAIPGVEMQRSMLLVNHAAFQRPLVLDVLKVRSQQTHQYDLPFYFIGHLMNTNYEYQSFTDSRALLGRANGYQHLWVEAKGRSNGPTASMTWLNGNRFYTVTTLTDDKTELYLNRIGGTDPDFNLRNEPCFMVRQNNAGNHTFVSAIEVHGDYNPQMEYTIESYPNVASVKLLQDTDDYTVVEIKTKNGETITVCLANNRSDKGAVHRVGAYSWTGVCAVK